MTYIKKHQASDYEFIHNWKEDNLIAVVQLKAIISLCLRHNVGYTKT